MALELAGQLRAGGAQAITELLRARPDLSYPVPADLIDLAARALSVSSTHRALAGLDASRLRVLSGLAAGVAETLLLDLTGEDELATIYAELRGLMLVAGEPPRPTTAVRRILGPHPAGLAAVSPNPLSQQEIDQALHSLPQPEREILELLAWSPTPRANVEHAHRSVDLSSDSLSPVDRLLGLFLRPVDDRTVELPREVALTVRGGRLYDIDAGRPPLPDFGSGEELTALDEQTSASVAAWLLDELAADDWRQVLEQAADHDLWVRLAHAREDGTLAIDVVRVLLIAHGSAYLVRRAGRRLNLPLNRVIAARLTEPVIIQDLASDLD